MNKLPDTNIWLKDIPFIYNKKDDLIVLEGKIIQITKSYVRFAVEGLCIDFDRNDIEKVESINDFIELDDLVYLFIKKNCHISDIFINNYYSFDSKRKPFAISSRSEEKYESPRSSYFDKLNRNFLLKYDIKVD